MGHLRFLLYKVGTSEVVLFLRTGNSLEAGRTDTEEHHEEVDEHLKMSLTSTSVRREEFSPQMTSRFMLRQAGRNKRRGLEKSVGVVPINCHSIS